MRMKRRLANMAMIVIILLIAAAGLYAVGNVRGWFCNDENMAVLTDIRGIVRVERSGVTYPLEEKTTLKVGDRLICDAGATTVIRLNNGMLTLGGNAQINIQTPDADDFAAEVGFGEVFLNVEKETRLSFEGRTICLADTVSMLSVRSGAQTLTVLEGTAENVAAGQTINWVGREKSIGDISIQALNNFAIEQIRIANRTSNLCINDEALTALEEERNAAMSARLVSGEDDGLTCSIAIYCDTILDNWDNLDTAKASYVPQNGVILAPTLVEFEAGETVFDVLTRVCEVYDIQIEYSWTPLYDSYYIEGIHQLYEFDCGSQSGWMYKVNEWFPNYGCSEYKLIGGESIVWCYTCNGLGADVGGGTY